MLKTKQNQKNIFLFIKLILLAGVVLLIVQQFNGIGRDDWQNLSFNSPISLGIAILLVYPNIWAAYKKWLITLEVVKGETETSVKRHSFFAGLVTGMLTPNMVGNFIGRFYYFPREYRVSIILFTLLSNYAQFLASLTFGWISILIVGELIPIKEITDLTIWIGVGVIIAYLAYFFIDNFLVRLRRRPYLKAFREQVKLHPMFRVKMIAWSLIRFSIFTLQFSLVLHAFGQPMNLDTIFAIWQVYLLTMLVPSLVLGKVGVRESVAIFVLVPLGMNSFAILFSSLIIWLINSVSPALLGFVICKPKNV